MEEIWSRLVMRAHRYVEISAYCETDYKLAENCAPVALSSRIEPESGNKLVDPSIQAGGKFALAPSCVQIQRFGFDFTRKGSGIRATVLQLPWSSECKARSASINHLPSDDWCRCVYYQRESRKFFNIKCTYVRTFGQASVTTSILLCSISNRISTLRSFSFDGDKIAANTWSYRDSTSL